MMYKLILFSITLFATASNPFNCDNLVTVFQMNDVQFRNTVIVKSLSSNLKTGDQKNFKLKNGLHISMIWVGPGSYTMGSPESEVGRNAIREKQQKVTIETGYWMAATELTQKQWIKVMGFNPSQNKGDNFPVEQVTYQDIENFISKINELQNEINFRLPTEREWEYACRAGTQGPYAGKRDDLSWHSGNSGRMVHAVAQKKPNAWGFYDMHGNILEFCSDWFHEDNSKDISKNSGKRVLRGGQYTGRIRHSRSADRQRITMGEKNFFIGFRLAGDSN